LEYAHLPARDGQRGYPVNFRRNQALNFWMQVYNLGIDDATKSNQATVTYQIVDLATNTVVFEKQMESKT